MTNQALSFYVGFWTRCFHAYSRTSVIRNSPSSLETGHEQDGGVLAFVDTFFWGHRPKTALRSFDAVVAEHPNPCALSVSASLRVVMPDTV
jgi:hypothetical protein